MEELLMVPLGQVEDISLVGGKARALSQLIKSGFDVPPGFVVTAEASQKMSRELEKAILDDFDSLGARQVAVRSSAVAEDAKGAAWAGQLDTFLSIDRSHLLDAVKKCWGSANSPRARAYAKQKGLQTGAVAVVVQVMIPSEVSGVAFSVHPVTKNRNHMIIEVVRGLAEPLVSGEVTPDSYIIDKKTGQVIEIHTKGKKNMLTDKQITEVSDAVKRLEKYFAFPVDVEWTIAQGKLYILQSRPVTALG